MADDERPIKTSALAQNGSLASPASAAVAKSSPRRRAVSTSETSLSTPGGPVIADVDLPATSVLAEATARPKAAKVADPVASAMSGPSSGSDQIKAPAAHRMVSSAPGAAAKPVGLKAKPLPKKPLPVKSAPAKAVAATKPVPPQPVATKPASLKPPVPAAKSAPAYPRSKAAPDQGPVSAAPRAIKAASTNIATYQPAFSLKDMTMDMSANFSNFQSAMTEAQAKAQAAFEKSSSMLGEVGEFAKGNVEAMVASGKILAEGVQEMGNSMVAESRTAFESMTGDVKELAAAKSPTEFLKLQSDMVRKNFDSAVAYSSKNTETFLKLMNDAFAPISGRVSLAVEKARQVAPMGASVSAPSI